MKISSRRSDAQFFCAVYALTFLLFAIYPQSVVAQTNTFPQSGNVGIGTTSPPNPLTIARSESAPWTGRPAYELLQLVDRTDNTPQILFGSAYNGMLLRYTGLNTAVNQRLGIFTGGLVEAFVVNNDGNVGIGTSSPDAYGFGSGYSFLTQQAVGTNQSALLFSLATGTGGSGIQFGNATIRRAAVYVIDGSHMLFYVNANNSSTALTEAMRITPSGNVGIGTTTPAYKLDVAGVINSSAGGFRFPDGSVQITAASNGTSSTAFSGVTAGTNTVALVVGSGGSLGVSGSGTINATTLGGATFAAPGAIGGTTPGSGAFSAVGINIAPSSYKLDVNGNTNVTGNVTVGGTGNITAAGTIEAGNIKAKYQDVAEWVPSSEQIPTGTVVVLDSTKSNQVISSTQAYDTRVAGVISAQPGIALGEPGDDKVLVATIGRVRLMVDASKGPIQIGDLLVTSDIPGVAMKSEAINVGGVQIHRPGTLIGKALEPLPKGRGEILVLLSLQ